MGKGRVDYFDILKTFAIFFVCYLHFDLLNDGLLNNFSIMICTAGVPVFFMVNGALLLNAKFDLKKHMKKLGWVAFAYFVWRIITLIGLVLIQKQSFSSFGKADLLQYALGGSIEGVLTGHFWFMDTLLALYIIFPLLKVCFDHKNSKTILTILCSFLFILRFGVIFLDIIMQAIGTYTGLHVFSFSSLGVFNIFGSNGTFLLYFLLGAMLHKYLFIEKHKIPHLKLIAGAAVIIGWILFFCAKAYETGATGSQHGVISEGYTRISSFIMSVGFFCLFIGVQFKCTSFTEKQTGVDTLPSTDSDKKSVWGKLCNIVQIIVSSISKNTLCIYYLHWLMGFAMGYITQYFDPFKSIWLNFLKALAMVVLGTLIGTVLKKIPGIKKIV